MEAHTDSPQRHSAACGRNQNGLLRVLRPLQSLTTETTEDLSDLCVESFLATEDTEALLVREEISARRQEVWE
jgi:hypothetical protein